MQFSLPHNIKKVGTIILGVSIPLLVFVWSYLEKVLPIKSKQELETIYLVQLIFTVTIILLDLSAFIVFLIIRKKEINNIGNSKSIEKQSFEYQIDYSILLQILKLRDLNEIASPQNIYIFERINLRRQSALGIELKKSCEGLRIFLNPEKSYLSFQNFPTER